MKSQILGYGLVLAMLASPLAAEDKGTTPDSFDGLVEVKASKFDDAFLLPGADFRTYRKLMIDPAEVAFRKDWVRDMNSGRSLVGRVTEADAKKIMSLVKTDTGEIFSQAFAKAGYEFVSTAGADVLRVTPSIINLYVNAPDIASANRTMTFTTEAGQATLILELRDSLTNALLARVVDRRVAERMGGFRNMPTMSNSVTNRADLERTADIWAKASVKGLETLKAQSPVPSILKPGQKLK